MHTRRGTPDPESRGPGRVNHPGAAAAAARLRERLAAVTTAAAPDGGGEPGLAAEDTQLHDLRVACRRLETALRMWARGADAREARRHTRALRRAGGPAREREVLSSLLRTRRLGAAAVPSGLRAKWLERLARGADAARRSAFPGPRAVKRLAARVERVVQALEPDAEIAARADRRLARWRRSGLSRLSAGLASGEARALHRARLAVKRWRYAEEERAAFAKVEVPRAAEARRPPERAGKPVASLRRWQRLLGELSDRALLIAYARSSGAQGRRLVPRLEALRLAAVAGIRRPPDAPVSKPHVRGRRA